MKEKKFMYAVKIITGKREVYTLKTFTSLQNARKYVKKQQQYPKWGLPLEEGIDFQIYKHDIKTGKPITIYLN